MQDLKRNGKKMIQGRESFLEIQKHSERNKQTPNKGEIFAKFHYTCFNLRYPNLGNNKSTTTENKIRRHVFRKEKNFNFEHKIENKQCNRGLHNQKY